MLGQYAPSAASGTDSRVFVYEVSGLGQNEMAVKGRSPIRSSQNQRFQVSFHRMSEEMRRITLLGGEIVNISLLNANNAVSPPEVSTAENSPEVANTSAE